MALISLDYKVEAYNADPMDEVVTLKVEVQGEYASVLVLLDLTRQDYKGISEEDDDPEPRVWQSIRDVPEGVVVTDRDGSKFIFKNRVLHHRLPGCDYDWGHMNLHVVDRDLAPWTEVLDA